MRRSLTKDFLVLSIGTFLNILISFITTPIITRLVDPGQYGDYALYLVYGNIIQVAVALGLDQALMRYFYKSEDNNYKKALLTLCFSIPFALATAVLAALLFVQAFRGVSASEFYKYIAFSFYTLFIVVNLFSGLVLRLQFKNIVLSVSTVLNKVVFVAVSLALVVASSLVKSVALLVGATVAIALVTLWQIFSGKELWKLSFKTLKNTQIPYRELFRYAIPLGISSGIAVLFQGMDRLFLGWYANSEQVGIYASALTLVNLVAVIRSSFNTIWAPAAIEHYENDRENRSFYIKGNDVIAVVMFGVMFTLIAFKDPIVLLLGEQYREAAYLIPLLLFSPVFYTVSETTVIGIAFKQKSYLHVLVGIASLLADVVANLLFVPLYGAKGSAMAAALSCLVFFLLRSYFGHRCYPILFNYRRLGVVIALAFGYACWATFFPTSLLMFVTYFFLMSVLVALYLPTVKYLLTKARMTISRSRLR